MLGSDKSRSPAAEAPLRYSVHSHSSPGTTAPAGVTEVTVPAPAGSADCRAAESAMIPAREGECEGVSSAVVKAYDQLWTRLY